MTDPARYRFAPVERRGVVAGLSPGQVAAVAGGLAVAVVALRTVPGPAGAAAAAVAVASGLVVAFVSAGGRRVEEWVPVVLRWAADGVATRSRRWVSAAPGLGSVVRVPSRGPDPHPSTGDGQLARRPAAPPASPPPALTGCRVRGPGDTGGIAVIEDATRGSATAVLSLGGDGFSLLDRRDQERRVAAWASVLAGLAREGGAVHRVQWVERARPAAPPAEAPDVQASGVPDGAAASYAELIVGAGAAARHHEVFLAVSTRARRGGRAVQAGGGVRAQATVLAREVGLLEAGLRSADVDVEGLLGGAALERVLATGFDPYAPPGSGTWPVGAECTWSAWRSDGWWHATYWVSEWPRTEVGPDFLASMLLLGPAVRAVSMVMEPIAPGRAAREAEAARTSGLADDELRRRAGFLATARLQRQREGTARRESELADGHADYRFSGYVTVSAPGRDALEEACGEAEHVAGQSCLQLRRLYGQQDEAFAFTLPLGRGLR